MQCEDLGYPTPGFLEQTGREDPEWVVSGYWTLSFPSPGMAQKTLGDLATHHLP